MVLQSTLSYPQRNPLSYSGGGERCLQPYLMLRFNISAMSFGALSGRAESKRFNQAQNSVDLLMIQVKVRLVRTIKTWRWFDLELGNGYFGCRNHDGTFSPEKFAERSRIDKSKWLKSSCRKGQNLVKAGFAQGKITRNCRNPWCADGCRLHFSPASHSAFTTPREMVQFWQQRNCRGKPVWFLSCVSDVPAVYGDCQSHDWNNNVPWFYRGWMVPKAVQGLRLLSLWIMLAAPTRWFLLVHNTLVGAGVRDKIKIGVSVKSSLPLISLAC